jgi:hypothetical protein
MVFCDTTSALGKPLLLARGVQIQSETRGRKEAAQAARVLRLAALEGTRGGAQSDMGI